MTPKYFYPRPPRGGRQGLPLNRTRFEIFLSTPSARRATKGWWEYRHFTPISIHALREEGDLLTSIKDNHPRIFLSTPSARRATKYTRGVLARYREFLSTPSARRATRSRRHPRRFACISIHALREEGDRKTDPTKRPGKDFYPRPPRGGRPVAYSMAGTPPEISIHALREEGD